MTSLERYLSAITNNTQLDKDQQHALIDIIRNSEDKNKINQAVDDLVRGTVFLVVKCANSYKKKTKNNLVDIMDLIAMGNIGLIKAARMYDPDNENGATFSTYAYACINSHIVKELKKTRVVRIPANYYTYNNKIKALRSQHGDTISDDFICKELKIQKQTLNSIKESFDTSFIYIDGFVTEGGCPYDIDVGQDDGEKLFDELDKRDTMKLLERYIDKLPEKQGEVIKAMYLRGKKHTLDDLAKEFQTSRQNMSSLRQRGIVNLKRLLKGKEIEFNRSR